MVARSALIFGVFGVSVGSFLFNFDSAIAGPLQWRRASENRCSSMFSSTSNEARSKPVVATDAGVSWLPFTGRQSVRTPDVIADPYITVAQTSETFWRYLNHQAAVGTARIVDYKQLADAEPLYETKHGPWLPVSSSTGTTVSPHEISSVQLLDYIFKNYKLGDSSTVTRARFSSHERVREHPLMAALRRQGLIGQSPGRQGEWNEFAIQHALRRIHEIWEELLQSSRAAIDSPRRGSLLELPNKYIVAGGRFREMYFWDSYWIMKGLIESGYGKTALGMLENFVSMFEKYGVIPNGNRFYYLTRTQPPVLMEMVKLLEANHLLKFSPERFRSRKTLEARVLKVADAYYLKIWKGTERFKEKFGLFSYSDGAGGAMNLKKQVYRPERGLAEPPSRELHAKRAGAEPGWDFSETRFGNDPHNWLPIDLNSILYGYAEQLAAIYKKVQMTDRSLFFSEEAQSIQRNIQMHLFDQRKRLYVDFHIPRNQQNDVLTAASFFPFYFGLYSKNGPEGAASRAKLIRLLTLLKPAGSFGVHTTTREGSGQWDGSWTWAPLNEIAFQSLLRYGLVAEARALAFDYCAMVITAFYKNGFKFFEKYRSNGSIQIPSNSEIYGNEEGFGWTNGTVAVFLRFLSNQGQLPMLEAEVRRKLAEE